MRIEAGKKSQVRWTNGDWIFLDIGFAKQARRTCGLLFGDGRPEIAQFGEGTRQIVEHIKKSNPQVNLVIEAPLSVCFDPEGNPKGRLIEREGNVTRYWYNGPGCVVMVAAMYLIRLIHEAKSDVLVRLFEGFVSFRDSAAGSDHKKDVCALREVVRDPKRFRRSIYSAQELGDPKELHSAFRVGGLDCGIPVVIKGCVR